MTAIAQATCALLLGVSPASSPVSAGPVQAAISGISASPSGNLLVSPVPGDPPAVLEIGLDGALVKSWAFPDGEPVTVVGTDPSARPILFAAGAGKVLVLDPASSTPAASISLSTLKDFPARTLTPVVRAAADGGVMVATGDGASLVHATADGSATAVTLSGSPGPLTDFDVASDGRIAVVDSATPQSLRLYSPKGELLAESALATADAESPPVFAEVRFIPGGSDLWVLELPPTRGEGNAALSRWSASGRRVSRLDRLSDGTPLGPVAGMVAVREGIWLVALDGNARRLDEKGKLLARFDATPAPRAVSWEEKKRLLAISAAPESATLPDAVAALAVTRARKADLLWAKVTGQATDAAPLVVDAVVKGGLDAGTLAEFFRRTLPGTREQLAPCFTSKSPAVRAGAVAALGESGTGGFDQELARISSDPDPDVRAAGIYVLGRARWSSASVPLMIARLADPDSQNAELSAQILAAHLAQSVEALARAVKDPKGSERSRVMAARALLLDVPGGNQLPLLPPDKHGPLKGLALSEQLAVRRVGVLGLVIHADPSAPAAFEKAWHELTPEQKQLGLAGWSGASGEAGSAVLIRLLQKEKNQDLRGPLFGALGRHKNASAIRWLVEVAKKPGDERDRTFALELVPRRLSDAEIVALAGELPQAGTDFKKAILRLVALRGVSAAADAVAGVANLEAVRPEAFAALFRLGSTAGVPVAVQRVLSGAGSQEVELAYLAAVGGLPADAKPHFRELANGKGAAAPLAAETLARGGDASGIQALLDRARTDHYGGSARDPSLAGALAALKEAGRAAADSLLGEKNPAAREDALLALALQGGDGCADVRDFGRSRKGAGVAVPAVFYALAACGDAKGAADYYSAAAKNESPSDPAASTIAPRAFASLLSEMLRQPDFRAKADPVLQAVAMLPRPVLQECAQSLSGDLHPAVAMPVVRYLF